MPFNLKLHNVSVVVLATNNNPRLLNPDFLQRNGIVPSDWKATDTLVTPPFSQSVFNNGVTIQLDESRFTVQSNLANEIEWQTALPAIIEKFMNVLPHVDYRAAGMNFVFMTSEPTGQEAEDILIKNMLKTGEWADQFGELSGVVYELQFRNQQPSLNVKVGAHEQLTPQGPRINGFIVIANLHHEFPSEQKRERIEFIKTLGNRHEETLSLLRTLPLGVD